MTEHQRLMDALGKGELPADLAAHAASCTRCRAAVEAHRALAPPAGAPRPSGPLSLSPAVASELASVAGRPAQSPWRRPVMLGVLQILLSLAVVVAMGRRGLVLNGAGPLPLIGLALALGACALGGTLAAMAPGFRRLRLGLAALAVTTAGLVGLGGSGLPGSGSFTRDGMSCTVVEVACAVLPLGVALWLLRGFAFDPLRALVGSLAAAATGVFALHLHCPVGTADHLYVFHVVPWLLMGGLGLFLRSQLRSRTFAP